MTLSNMNRNHKSDLLNDNGADFMDIKTKATPVAMVAPELKQVGVKKGILRTCAVMGCEDYKHLDSDSFFQFPKDPDRRQTWTHLTGRVGWIPTDYSYICLHHFAVDCFYCPDDNGLALDDKAVPTLKLPKHVLEGEYIDEALETDDDIGNLTENGEFLESQEDTEEDSQDFMSGDDASLPRNTQHRNDPSENLILFTEVQNLQHEVLSLKDKLKKRQKLQYQQNKHLKKLQDLIHMKKTLVKEKNKKKNRILLSIQDKIREDSTGLVMAMPTKQTEDFKDFALSIYKYSPQSYIYVRNMLRTLLPSTDVLESWLLAGFRPTNVASNKCTVKLITEQSARELNCKISLQ